MEYVADTNLFMEDVYLLDDYEVLVILNHVLRELDKHKFSSDKGKQHKARVASRYIDDNLDRIKFDFYDYRVEDERLDSVYEDNKIITACIKNNYILITFDRNMKHIAKGYGVDVIELDNKVSKDINYTGVYDLYIDNTKEAQETLAAIYESPDLNQFDLVKNQYLYIWDKEKPTYNDKDELNGYEFIDCFKWEGKLLTKLKYKQVFSRYIGEKVKPINMKQRMLFDLLQDDSITIKSCFGKFGVGKDYVMLSHALQLIDSGKIDKIIWARNNVELEDVPTLGILPGDKTDKLIEFAMPLADHVGGVEGLKMLMAENKLEIQHIGSLRGRDIKNSILYVTESQNNTVNHFELMVGRIGQGSQLWLNGDLKQTDNNVYRNKSGIRALSNLAGEDLVGMVTLDKTERSDTAELAEKLSK